MNKIGIHFGYWNRDWNTDFPACIKRASEVGLDILEIAPAPLFEMSEAKRKEIRQASLDYGIELTYSVGLGLEYDIASEDDTVRKNGIHYSTETMKLIGEMGGHTYSGINYSSWNKTFAYGIENKDAYFERSAQSLKQIMKVAETYDIKYCMEVVNRFEQYLLNTAEEAVKLAQMVNHPNLKLLLDTFHMNIEETSFVEAIHTAAPYLGHFHIGEANRRPPCAGRMPWDSISGALKGIGYEQALVMEPFLKMGGEVGRDIKIWRDLSKGADDAEMDEMIRMSVSFVKGLMT